MQISVVICTHNPRAAYIERVLAALQRQTLPRDRWELIVIDNASAEPIAARIDLGWHPNARHVLESELGLTPARLRGVAESRTDLLVFVDDDNVIADDYLEQAIAIEADHPFLGAWGGSISGGFEVPVPGYARTSLQLLAIKEVDAPVWSNHMRFSYSHPCGAGLCVRRKVAETYAASVLNSPAKRLLDRRGKSLASAGDIDLIFTSGDLGLGWGCFPALRMEHLMPAERLSRDYLKRLCYSGTQSWNVLLHSRDLPLDQAMPKARRLAKAGFLLLRYGPFQAQMFLRQQRALEDSQNALRDGTLLA